LIHIVFVPTIVWTVVSCDVFFFVDGLNNSDPCFFHNQHVFLAQVQFPSLPAVQVLGMPINNLSTVLFAVYMIYYILLEPVAGVCCFSPPNGTTKRISNVRLLDPVHPGVQRAVACW
jgi:hypothetical protein